MTRESATSIALSVYCYQVQGFKKKDFVQATYSSLTLKCEEFIFQHAMFSQQHISLCLLKP